jgi:hypothetical protein
MPVSDMPWARIPSTRASTVGRRRTGRILSPRARTAPLIDGVTPEWAETGLPGKLMTMLDMPCNMRIMHYQHNEKMRITHSSLGKTNQKYAPCALKIGVT